MKAILITVCAGLFMSIIIVGFVLTVAMATDRVKFQKHIGEEYILDNNTLTIIDYSILEETYTLSNGRIINSEMVSFD